MSLTHYLSFSLAQDRYIDQLESRCRRLEEESTAQQQQAKKQQDVSRREHLLVMRLSAKEQELQELSGQVSELKAAQVPTASQLRATLVDPGVNVIIQRLKVSRRSRIGHLFVPPNRLIRLFGIYTHLQKELEETRKKWQETQDELSAWKFTPDSATGKRLMAKCRQLLQENEDIGKMISSGRLAKLETDLAMQKTHCYEMKKNQE